MSFESNITIITGRFGSGKTEIALNYAVQLAGRGDLPLLVDLDIVTPYFLTREKAAEMAEQGVKVIAPFEEGQRLHVPAISPRILGAIEQRERPVVLDVGGDQQGARALSQYASAITGDIPHRRSYDMRFVVNPYRPFMDTIEGIAAAVREIEASAGLRVSSLVSNPNLMLESTAQIFWEGHRLVVEAARSLELPVSLAVVSEALAEKINWQDHALPILVIHRFFLMLNDMS